MVSPLDPTILTPEETALVHPKLDLSRFLDLSNPLDALDFPQISQSTPYQSLLMPPTGAYTRVDSSTTARPTLTTVSHLPVLMPTETGRSETHGELNLESLVTSDLPPETPVVSAMLPHIP
jgi:hypothetical protein